MIRSTVIIVFALIVCSRARSQSVQVFVGGGLPAYKHKDQSFYSDIRDHQVGFRVVTGQEGSGFGLGFEWATKSYTLTNDYSLAVIASERGRYRLIRLVPHGVSRLHSWKRSKLSILYGLSACWVSDVCIEKAYSDGTVLLIEEPANQNDLSVSLHLALRYTKTFASRLYAFGEGTITFPVTSEFTSEADHFALLFQANPPPASLIIGVNLGMGFSLGKREARGKSTEK